MATINPTFTRGIVNDDSVMLVTWASLTEADTATALEFTEWCDRCVEFSGTFNGGTAILEGSNAGSTFYGLNDMAGSPISKTAAGISQVAEVPRYTRPRVSAGTGVSLTVTMIMRRNNPLRT